MYKSGPKWKHGGPNLGAKDIFIRFLKTWALNGGTLSLFFNENKKESLNIFFWAIFLRDLWKGALNLTKIKRKVWNV